MGRFVPRVEKNHPNHFGQNKVGEPVKTCRYCQNLWEYDAIQKIRKDVDYLK